MGGFAFGRFGKITVSLLRRLIAAADRISVGSEHMLERWRSISWVSLMLVWTAAVLDAGRLTYDGGGAHG
jgi:hypothetical protein